MAITFSGPDRLIMLDGSLTVSIRAIYARWIDWANTSDNAKFLAAFSVVADPPTIPVYATLQNGWKIQPLGGAYTLTLDDGFLYSADNLDPFAPVTTGGEPRIRYENPVIAVGYDAGGGGGSGGGGTAALTPEQDLILRLARDHARAANVQTQPEP